MAFRTKDGLIVNDQQVIDGSKNIIGNTVESTTTTSAPLTVNSTVKVENLNAALLDGNDSNYFVGLIDTVSNTNSTLQSSINAEISARVLADNNLQTAITIAIDAEVTARTQAILTEQSVRVLADNSLQTAITTAIDSEVLNRIAADTSLQSTFSDASNLTSGIIDTARLGTGTANSTTYLRGDNTWQTLNAGSMAFFENDIIISTDYAITSGKNAMSAGPITVASGSSVTVPSGSTWTIV
jgi:hypothetical protein